MNSIPIKQNEVRQLERLAAQRQLYASAKRIFGWQVFVSAPVPVALALFALRYPDVKPYGALWGVFVVLADVFWLTRWSKRLRSNAARVQELFDCEVLELPWDELKVGKRPDPELIREQSDKYQRWAATMPPLQDWYDRRVGELPLSIARLACQRSNCWWDANQRRRYAVWVIASVCFVFALLLLVSIASGFTMADVILMIIVPLSPAMVVGLRQYNEQTEAAARLDNLKTHAERIWNEALAKKSESKALANSRSLQSEIFENRQRSPLVFDAIFKRIRDDHERQMNFGTAELAEQARKKLGLPPADSST